MPQKRVLLKCVFNVSMIFVYVDISCDCFNAVFIFLFLIPLCLSEASAEHACGPPPIVRHAQFKITEESHLRNVSYLCDTGMQLMGPKTLTCQADGTWSLPAPTCEGTQARLKESSCLHLLSFFIQIYLLSLVARSCDGPVQLLNGRVQDHNLNSGRALEFQCDKGFSLVGDHLVVCLGGNTWSSAFPTCQRETFLALIFQ